MFNLPGYAVIDALDLPSGGRRVVIRAVDSGRAVDEVDASFGVAWWTVQAAVTTAAVTLPDPDTVPVRELGVDEHRFTRARFFRDTEDGSWRRVEPWMSTFVNTATGQVLGVVDGRGSAGTRAWLEARNQAWRQRAGNCLSARASRRLEHVLRTDDPTGEIGAAWGVKERLRMLLACTDIEAARQARMRLGLAVLGADMTETWRLWETVNDWWPEIETFIATRVTNARTEAANTAIKHIKRTGRGYRNPDHYQTRILLRSARRARRRPPVNQQATTFSCG